MSLIEFSFIIIGKNIAKTLPDVFAELKKLSLLQSLDLKIIYVDSDSNDSSLTIAKSFRTDNPLLQIKIFQIYGDINSAIARNVGINNLDSQTEYVFFLDGDIVFNKDFLIEAIKILEINSNFASVTGQIIDSFDELSNITENRPSPFAKVDSLILWHGGNFVIKKTVLDKVGIFDIHLVKHQDIDFCFKIRNKGFSLWKTKTLLGIHHTTSYMNHNRIFNDIKEKKFISSGILFRKYIFTKRCIDMLKSINGIVIRFCILMLFVLSLIHLFFLMLSAIFIVYWISKTKLSKGETYTSRLLSLASGLQFFWGILKKRKKLSYTVKAF